VIPDLRAAVIARSDAEPRQDLALALVEVVRAFFQAGAHPGEIADTLMHRERAEELFRRLTQGAGPDSAPLARH
jgi:hypothetical protein